MTKKPTIHLWEVREERVTAEDYELMTRYRDSAEREETVMIEPLYITFRVWSAGPPWTCPITSSNNQGILVNVGSFRVT